MEHVVETTYRQCIRNLVRARCDIIGVRDRGISVKMESSFLTNFGCWSTYSIRLKNYCNAQCTWVLFGTMEATLT